jgi:hypothetical protein
MPEKEIKKRGGAIRYRTKKLDGKYIHIAVVPQAGPRGGHTIAGPVHEKKSSQRKFEEKRIKQGAKRW